LESHYGMPRILSLVMGDKKAFYYLLFFWESNSNVEDAIAVDALANFGNICCSNLDRNFIICRTCLVTVQILMTENLLTVGGLTVNLLAGP
jgi:hypothetical protein